jgi:hypothetical protein
VKNDEISPMDALKKSLEKPDMMKKLNQAGFRKALKNTDLSEFDSAEFVETE